VNVNGSRFQLLKGAADWLSCHETDAPEGPLTRVEWDDAGEWLTLKPLLSLFPQSNTARLLDPDDRRGAAVDQYGNWYWIAHDRQRIFWLPEGGRRPSVYWAQERPARPIPPGGFGPSAPLAPAPATLAGLAVTEHHYLVVGNVTQRGVFRFDLHAGGDPWLLLFPEGVSFQPFDVAAARGGGVWILDRLNRRYWGLDRDFRLVTAAGAPPPAPAAEVPSFGPVGDVPPVHLQPPTPRGFALAASDPVAIEALPDGSVLVLDRAPTPASASLLYRYRRDVLLGQTPLAATVNVASASSETITAHLAVGGHDLVYRASDATLYVVEDSGVQVIPFTLKLDAPSGLAVEVKRDYLPLHFYGRRALVARDDAAYYDVVAGDAAADRAVRWVQLRALGERRYERSATLVTRVFDGKERDCVWDRLLLDACIPPETSVRITTRASNDALLIGAETFDGEPPLYLRSGGAEVPYYDPFPEQPTRPPSTGTWELLFQRATGRYLQVQLELGGNERSTPMLRALRAYYPRFSYPRRYLPAVYLEEPTSASFLERLLANPEGFYTEIDGKIHDVRLLFDPRSAPPETLDWLAQWVGLVVDPLWGQLQRRRQPTAAAGRGAPADRRRLLIRFAMRLYARRGTPDGIRLALLLLLDPCLEEQLQRFQRAAVAPDAWLQDELAALNLPYPSPLMREEDVEDLLVAYLLSPGRPSKVRLVERFLTRGGRAAAQGDPTGGSTASGAEEVGADAHRFSVLVPEALPADEAAMVQRIVELEKPAHTAFDVRRYWDYFRVGEARIGTDTVLGEDSRFLPIVLGQSYLAEGYLSAAYPGDVPDRVVADRDLLGSMPSL
jgi:phage tail-like protein